MGRTTTYKFSITNPFLHAKKQKSENLDAFEFRNWSFLFFSQATLRSFFQPLGLIGQQLRNSEKNRDWSHYWQAAIYLVLPLARETSPPSPLFFFHAQILVDFAVFLALFPQVFAVARPTHGIFERGIKILEMGRVNRETRLFSILIQKTLDISKWTNYPFWFERASSFIFQLSFCLLGNNAWRKEVYTHELKFWRSLERPGVGREEEEKICAGKSCILAASLHLFFLWARGTRDKLRRHCI